MYKVHSGVWCNLKALLRERGEAGGMHLEAWKHEDVGESHLGRHLGQRKLEQKAKKAQRWEKAKEESGGQDRSCIGCVVLWR